VAGVGEDAFSRKGVPETCPNSIRTTAHPSNTSYKARLSRWRSGGMISERIDPSNRSAVSRVLVACTHLMWQGTLYGVVLA
jgi:hypothetical protein